MSPPKKATDTIAKLDKYRLKEKGTPGENGADAPSSPESAADDTAQVLEAISDCKSTLTGKIGEVRIDVSLIKQDLQKLRERVTETENRISRVKDEVPPIQIATERMQHQLNTLLSKQDDMENRLRQCNLRSVGLPKGAEGSDPLSFLENLLISTFGRPEFSFSFVVERAHRLVARPPPPQGAPPRTFIEKFLNFRDRDAILRLTRLKGNIPFKNSKIKVFTDFSAEVQKKRVLFMEAKCQLRIRHYTYAMLFPARLRMVGEDRAHFFDTPKAVFAWLEDRAASNQPHA